MQWHFFLLAFMELCAAGAEASARAPVPLKDVSVLRPDGDIADVKIRADDAEAIMLVARQASIQDARARVADAPWGPDEPRPRCLCKRVAVHDPSGSGKSIFAVLELQISDGAYQATALTRVFSSIVLHSEHRGLKGSTIQEVTGDALDMHKGSDSPVVRRAVSPTMLPALIAFTAFACVASVASRALASGARQGIIRRSDDAQQGKGVQHATLLEDGDDQTIA